MNNSKWKQRKKVFFDRFPQIESRKTEKFVPPAEKQLSYPEQAYKYCRFVEGIKEDG